MQGHRTHSAHARHTHGARVSWAEAPGVVQPQGEGGAEFGGGDRVAVDEGVQAQGGNSDREQEGGNSREQRSATQRREQRSATQRRDKEAQEGTGTERTGTEELQQQQQQQRGCKRGQDEEGGGLKGARASAPKVHRAGRELRRKVERCVAAWLCAAPCVVTSVV